MELGHCSSSHQDKSKKTHPHTYIWDVIMMHCAIGMTPFVLHWNEWLFLLPVSCQWKDELSLYTETSPTGQLVWKNDQMKDVHFVIVLHYRHWSKITYRKIFHCKAFSFHWQAWTSSSIAQSHNTFLCHKSF